MIGQFAELRVREGRTARRRPRLKRGLMGGDSAAEGFDGLEDWMVASGAVVTATP